MHLVTARFEPGEETFCSVPDLLAPWPLAVDDPTTLLFGQLAPWSLDRDAALAGELDQIVLALFVGPGLPGTDRAALECLRLVRNDQAVGAERLASVAPKDVPFNKDLIIGARVDRLVEEVDVEVVVDVLVTETAGGTARALVAPVVVIVGDVEMTEVDISERGVVADEGGLPMVVEVVP